MPPRRHLRGPPVPPPHDYEATHEELYELLEEMNAKLDRIEKALERR